MDSDYYTQDSQHSQSSRTSQDSLLLPARKAGTIKKIQMRNFMCHDNLEVTLNPRINFIIGKNGSGKSAIQTAVAVGFGGKALSTNRGSSLKDLIKNDKASCTIIIVISNEGNKAYKPEAYGISIKIERSFSHSSGSYKLKDSGDKVVSTEKKELDLIINHFNIEVENPLCILHQDVARTFLNSSNPKMQYKFYLKASKLGEIRKLVGDSTFKVGNMKEAVAIKTRIVEEAFRDVIEMKKKLEVIEDAKQKRKQCSMLEQEMLWAEVNEWNSEKKKLQKTLEQEQTALQKNQSKLEDIENNTEETKLSSLESKIKELNEKVQDAREKLGSAKEDVKNKVAAFSQSMAKAKAKKNNIKALKCKLECCKSEIEKIIKAAPESKQRIEQLKNELKENEEILESLKAAEQNCVHEKQQLNDTVDVTMQKLQAVEVKLNNIVNQKRKATEQLRHLSQSTSAVSIYGEAIVAIVDRMEKAGNQGKFTKKPIGPIGMYINVRDPNWAGAIENFLTKGFLSSFCVDNSNDLAVLSEIMKSVCARYKSGQPAIICSKFFNEVHSFQENETRTQQYTNLARALDIKNPVVANCLIDQLEAETVLLLPTNNEAYNLLDEDDKVPINCKKAFTLTGDEFIPAPNYKSYSAMKSVTTPALLQAKQENLIRELNNELSNLTVEVSQIGNEKREIQKQLGDTQQSVKRNEMELKNIRRKKYDTESKINQITDEVQDLQNQTNVGFLEEESQEIERELKGEFEMFEVMKAECEAAKAEFDKATAVHEEYKSIIDESDCEKAPIEAEIRHLKSIIHEAASRADLIKHQMIGQTKRVKEISRQLQEVEGKLATTTENASQICDQRIETDRTRVEIETELKGIKTYLLRLEENIGGSEEVIRNSLKEKEAAFSVLSKELTSLYRAIMNAYEILKDRRQRQIRLQHIMMISAKNSFQACLRERGFEGKLEFDTKEETLNIRVSRHSDAENNCGVRLDTSSLSGGEKSYATVCFILALWQELNLPFHFMDEFDVFMDGINRRVVLDMLLEHAYRSDQQYVFLTPLDTSSIPESKDITVHRLAPPREDRH